MSLSFSDIKRDYPIGWFFKNILQDQGSALAGRYSTCPACGKSDTPNKVATDETRGMFKCFKCGNKGDVIEATCLFFGCEKNEVSGLLGGDRLSAATYTPTAPAKKKDDRALLEVIGKISSDAKEIAPQVCAYLLSRGISVKTQNKAFEQGLLRSLPSTDAFHNFKYLKDLCGLDLLDAAGFISGEKKFAPASYRPLISISKGRTALEFRLIREKRDLESKVIRYGQKSPFYFAGDENLLVTEGAVDLLSALEMGAKSSVLGLPGVNSWEIDWFEPHKGKKVILALDDDEAGKTEARKITQAIESLCSISTYAIQMGAKDLNEELLKRRSSAVLRK